MVAAVALSGEGPDSKSTGSTTMATSRRRQPRLNIAFRTYTAIFGFSRSRRIE